MEKKKQQNSKRKQSSVSDNNLHHEKRRVVHHNETTTNSIQKQQQQFELVSNPKIKETSFQGLNIRYSVLFTKKTADYIYDTLERNIVYDAQSQVKIFGKTFDVPRKQKAYDDKGLTYTFSNVTVPASNWVPILTELRDAISPFVNNIDFNFVLINRYKDGQEYMGEHRDNETDLDRSAPTASLSFGQPRDFVFRHKNLKTYQPVVGK